MYDLPDATIKQSLTASTLKALNSTICVFDIYGFNRITIDLSPKETVNLIDSLHNTVDHVLKEFNAFKVEAVSDCFMVASGKSYIKDQPC
jgi:class 3 adenylate cyclase